MLPFEAEPEEDCSSSLERMATDKDELYLQGALKEKMVQMHYTDKFLVQLVAELVEDCRQIFTINDILTKHPVFSVKQAIGILEIFNEIFDDICNLPQTSSVLRAFFLHGEVSSTVSSTVDDNASDDSAEW